MVLSYVILLGMALGSFIGMAVVRIPAGESIWRPRSHCRNCQRLVRWYENIPIFSYLFLGGKCRGCGERISIKYLIIELVTTGITVATYLRFEPLGLFLTLEFLFVLPMLLLFFMDWEAMILPDSITLPGIGFGFFTHWAMGYLFAPVGMAASTWLLLGESLLGAVVGFLTLYLLATVYHKLKKVEGLGGGDIKLAAMIGAFFGWKAVFFIFFLASVAGSLFGVCLILLKRSTKGTPIPFGTFLAAACFLYLFYGPRLIQAYLGLFKFS